MIVPLSLCLLGAGWAAGLAWVVRWPLERHFWLTSLLVLGLVSRMVAHAMAPYEEIDFYRYFWDAKQVLNGLNPYAYPLADTLQPLPAEVHALQATHRTLIEGIRQDTHLFSTVYAPGAIIVFALLDALSEQTSTAFIASFLVAEIAAFGVLFCWGDRRDRRIGVWALALNPLLILVTYNGLHFDIWLVPLLVGWVMSLRHGRLSLALLLLGLAIALRHWPLLLLPLNLMAFTTWRQRGIAFAMLGIPIALVFWPQLYSYGSVHSGLRVYAHAWEMNDALFILMDDLFGHRVARLMALGFPAVTSIYFSLWKPRMDPALSGLLIVGLLLLLSPTFFPWYWLWLLPFVMLARVPLIFAGAAMVGVLPLYYLRFWLKDKGKELLFDHVVVWLEFSPIFALILAFVLLYVCKSYHSCS